MNIIFNKPVRQRIHNFKFYSGIVGAVRTSILTRPTIDDGVVRNLFMSFAVVSEKNKVPVLTKTQILNLLDSVGVETTGDYLDKMVWIPIRVLIVNTIDDRI